MKGPQYSIVIPCYNSGKYLEETIQSIINQTYGGFEIILIDGGSTDNSLEIISKYKQHFAYWVSEKDNGQTDAINKGFRKAKGDLLTWVCGDDLLYPDTLKIVTEFINKNQIALDEIGVIYGKSLNFTDNGKTSISNGESINLNALLHYNPNVLQIGSFHSRKILEKIDYLDDSLNYCMDYDLWIRVLQNGNIYYIPELLGKFRLHNESKTISQKEKFAWEILKRRYHYSRNIISPINLLLLRRIIAPIIKRTLRIKSDHI